MKKFRAGIRVFLPCKVIYNIRHSKFYVEVAITGQTDGIAAQIIDLLGVISFV